MKVISFLMVVLALTVIDGSICEQVPENVENVIELCSGRKLFHVTSLENMRQVIDIFFDKVTTGKCSKDLDDSFFELKSLLYDDVLNDVCGPTAFKRIKAYHKRFISPYVPEANYKELKAELKKKKNGIAESVRQFFILFAFQVNECSLQRAACVAYGERGEWSIERWRF